MYALDYLPSLYYITRQPYFILCMEAEVLTELQEVFWVHSDHSTNNMIPGIYRLDYCMRAVKSTCAFGVHESFFSVQTTKLGQNMWLNTRKGKTIHKHPAQCHQVGSLWDTGNMCWDIYAAAAACWSRSWYGLTWISLSSGKKKVNTLLVSPASQLASK